jgi:hypothetical protein
MLLKSCQYIMKDNVLLLTCVEGHYLYYYIERVGSLLVTESRFSQTGYPSGVSGVRINENSEGRIFFGGGAEVNFYVRIKILVHTLDTNPYVTDIIQTINS